MPALSDIVFECPHCDGPLIAEAAHAGLQTACPHCYEPLTVPSGEPVDKGVYHEPLGLRRVLEQVRDREWEEHRRKLRVALAHVSELGTKLHRSEEELAKRQSAAASAERLKAELSELNERFAQSSAVFESARRRADARAVELQRELQSIRAECERLRRENAEAAMSRGRAHGEARSQAKLTARLAPGRSCQGEGEQGCGGMTQTKPFTL